MVEWIKGHNEVIQTVSSVIQALVIIVTGFLAFAANSLSRRILTFEIIQKCKEIRLSKSLKPEQDKEIKRITEALLASDQRKIVYTLFEINGKEK